MANIWLGFNINLQHDKEATEEVLPILNEIVRADSIADISPEAWEFVHRGFQAILDDRHTLTGAELWVQKEEEDPDELEE